MVNWIRREYPLLLCALATLAAIILLSTPFAMAQTYAPLQNRPVIDAANIIPDDQEELLNQKLYKAYKTMDRQIVVATTPSLEGRPMSDYRNRYFRFLKLGQKDNNTGLLFVIAPNERSAGIEVGYGLEPYLTDAKTSEIIDEVMIPFFKDKDWIGGINAGVDVALPVISPDNIQKVLEKRKADQVASRQFWNAVSDIVSWVLAIGATVAGLWLALWGLVFRPARKRRERQEEEDRQTQLAAEKAYAEKLATERAARAEKERIEREQRERVERERERLREEATRARIEAERKAREDMLNAMTSAERKKFLADEEAERQRQIAAEKERQRLAAIEAARVAEVREAERKERARLQAIQDEKDRVAREARRKREAEEEAERARKRREDSYSSSSYDSGSSYSSSSSSSSSDSYSFSGDGGSSGGGGGDSSW